MTDFGVTVAICDAGPIIHLDELGHLGLLADFGRVVVTPTVWEEACRHRPGFWRVQGVPFERVNPIGRPSAEIETIARLLALHPGETEALHVARGLRGAFLLTDDTAARLAAKQLSLPVHGTIGILLRAIRRKQKSALEIVELLRQLPLRSTLHIKRELLIEIIDQVETSMIT